MHVTCTCTSNVPSAYRHALREARSEFSRLPFSSLEPRLANLKTLPSACGLKFVPGFIEILDASTVSEANLVRGWGPDGFAVGAGERRRSPGYYQRRTSGRNEVPAGCTSEGLNRCGAFQAVAGRRASEVMAVLPGTCRRRPRSTWWLPLAATIERTNPDVTQRASPDEKSHP